VAARALRDQSAETMFAAALGGIDNPAGILGEIDKLVAA
jgi:hypothetical protein